MEESDFYEMRDSIDRRIILNDISTDFTYMRFCNIISKQDKNYFEELIEILINEDENKFRLFLNKKNNIFFILVEADITFIFNLLINDYKLSFDLSNQIDFNNVFYERIKTKKEDEFIQLFYAIESNNYTYFCDLLNSLHLEFIYLRNNNKYQKMFYLRLFMEWNKQIILK